MRELLLLSLKELTESTFGDIFPLREFWPSPAHHDSDRFLNVYEFARGVCVEAVERPVLAGKSYPATEFSTPNRKYSATSAQSEYATGLGGLWNRHEQTAGTEAIF